MKKIMTSKRSILFFALGIGLVMMACSPSQNNNNNNTNTNTNTNVQLKCESGNLCLSVGHQDARSCDILLKDDATFEEIKVGFGDNVIGQYKSRGSQVAVSFITQKDESFGELNFPVILQLKNGVKGLSIDKVNCFDRNGEVLKEASVQAKKP